MYCFENDEITVIYVKENIGLLPRFFSPALHVPLLQRSAIILVPQSAGFKQQSALRQNLALGEGEEWPFQ